LILILDLLKKMQQGHPLQQR